jgi:hypothetical protein
MLRGLMLMLKLMLKLVLMLVPLLLMVVIVAAMVIVTRRLLLVPFPAQPHHLCRQYRTKNRNSSCRWVDGMLLLVASK